MASNVDGGESKGDDEDVPLPSAKGLIFFKTLYFLDGLSATSWGRFGVLYFNREKHLTSAQIGILQGVAPCIAMATQVFWGFLADELQSRKTIFVICKAGSTLLMLSMALPQVDSFDIIFWISCGMNAFSAGPVLDAHTLDFLGEKHKGMYGTIRLWTAVSWGIGAIWMGHLTDSYGFAVNFYVYGSMMFLQLAAVVFGLPARSKSEQEVYEQLVQKKAEEAEKVNRNEEEGKIASDIANEPSSASITSAPLDSKALWDTLLRWQVILWMVEATVIGAGMMIVDSFLFVYLENDLGATTYLCGLTVGVTVILELPIFHYSEELLKYLGHDALLILSMTSYSTRVIGYTLLTPETVEWILALETLHGITFACMWIVMVDYADSIAPKGWSSTFQSITSTVIYHIGGTIGPVVAGYVMDTQGGRVMFRGIGIIVGVLLYIHVTMATMCGHSHHKFLDELAAERKEEAEKTARVNEVMEVEKQSS